MPTSTGPVTFKKGTLYKLPVSEILASPSQLRALIDPEALSAMAASIATQGVLQPILFRLDEQGNKVVVAGERRLEAARQAGLETIPALYTNGNYAEIALAENELRQDLTAVEEAEGMQGLIAAKHYTQEELGAIVGKARNTVCEILLINNLPLEVRDDCRADRTIPKNSLIAIAKKKDPEAMTAAYQAYKAKHQQASPRPQKKDPNEPQAARAIVDRAANKLSTLDTSAWTADDHSYFKDSLVRMQTGIATYLNGPPS